MILDPDIEISCAHYMLVSHGRTRQDSHSRAYATILSGKGMPVHTFAAPAAALRPPAATGPRKAPPDPPSQPAASEGPPRTSLKSFVCPALAPAARR